MHALYMQVLTRSQVRFETLSVDFFRRIPDFLGGRVFALLCFQREELVAFELFLQDDDWLHPIYLGMSYAHRDEGSLYFSLLYKIIELAEAQGRPVVQLGQTSYPVKAAIGAVMARLYVAVRHDNRLLDWLLGRMASQLFPSTPIPPRRRVFRDMRQNNDGLKRHGIFFESHSQRAE
jgi:hypothetical protein